MFSFLKQYEEMEIRYSFFFVDRPFYQDSISLENPNHDLTV